MVLKYYYEPHPDIRRINIESSINKKITIDLKLINDQKQLIEISQEKNTLRGFGRYKWYSYSGWSNEIIGKEKTSKKALIKNIYFIERNDQDCVYLTRYKSYSEYFNQYQKELIQNLLKNKTKGSLISDRRYFDIIFILELIDINKIIKIHCKDDNFIYPEEWYSDIFANLNLDLNSFYINQEEILENIKKDEYKFIVIFNKDNIKFRKDLDLIKNSVEYADVSSRMIVKDRHCVFGCKVYKENVEIFLDKINSINGKILSKNIFDWKIF